MEAPPWRCCRLGATGSLRKMGTAFRAEEDISISLLFPVFSLISSSALARGSSSEGAESPEDPHERLEPALTLTLIGQSDGDLGKQSPETFF